VAASWQNRISWAGMGASEIRGDAAGLAALASQCQELAATVSAANVPAVSGLGGQPTVAAVQATHAAVTTAAARLAARMTDTATTAHTAAHEYTITDEDSAAQIGAVPDGLSEV
jgi:hypothetical protein